MGGPMNRSKYSKIRWFVISILALLTIYFKDSHVDQALAIAIIALSIAVYDRFFYWGGDA
jgi:hypothetical protein